MSTAPYIHRENLLNPWSGRVRFAAIVENRHTAVDADLAANYTCDSRGHTLIQLFGSLLISRPVVKSRDFSDSRLAVCIF